MPKQKYDNQAMKGERVAKAKANVRRLTGEGVRINKERASTTYVEALRSSGSLKEKIGAKKELQRRATGGKY